MIINSIGTSWTEVSDLNSAGTGSGGAGTSASAFIAGGSRPSYTANTEAWNGSSWTEINNMATARAASIGTGTSVKGIMIGGNTSPGAVSSCEEFSADAALSTITVS